MADGSGGQSLARQLDVIKTSVDLSEVTFLLVGTYALRAVVMPNGQLARRSSVVHFRPYQLDVEGDLKAFEEIFSQLVQALPLAAPERTLNAVENHTEEILFYCAGCVGVLKEWLLAALQQALEDARTHIPLSLLREKRPDNSTLLGIASDIYAYREDRSRATRSEIERKLGYGPKPIRSPTRSKSPTSSKSSLKPRRKPGVRAPARDPVY